MAHRSPLAGATALDAIGNTPVVRLRKVVPRTAAEVWVKLEGGNPTGSYKDRMARALIDEAEARGELRAGMSVVDIPAAAPAHRLRSSARSRATSFGQSRRTPSRRKNCAPCAPLGRKSSSSRATAG